MNLLNTIHDRVHAKWLLLLQLKPRCFADYSDHTARAFSLDRKGRS